MLKTKPKIEMIKAINPITEKEMIIKDLTIIYHAVPNMDGSLKKEKCVEFTIIGKNGEWKNWAFYNDFKKYNPNITIREE